MRHSRTRKRINAVLATSVFALVASVPLGTGGAAGALGGDSSALLTWSKLSPSGAPPARLHAAVALDVATGTTVLFGGRNGGHLLADTWTWDGSTWTARSPTTSPPPLESASMAYDNVARRIVLFGGVGPDGVATGDTWSWDGTTWTNLAPAPAPPARYAASVAADAATGTVVLFGGLSAPGSPLGDTWSWNGSAWAAEAAVTAPSGRSAAAMTFDATRGLVVLFGGMTGSDNKSDTWTWNGKNWAQLAPPASPPARTDAAFGFDDATQTAVLFGGTEGASGAALGDTWLWNGATWSTSLPLSLLPLLNPPARSGASIALGPTSHRPVLFGGQSGGATPTTFDDTWNVATLSTGPTATTSTTTPASAQGPTTTVPGPTPSSTALAQPPPAPAPSSAATPRPAPAGAPLKVTSNSVHRGQLVTVSGSGFVPGATVTITFHSSQVVVGTTKADAQGRFTATVSVPTDLPAGPHHIEAVGEAQTGGRAVLVAQVSVMVPPAHHGWMLLALMVALTVLLASGAGVVLTASTRGHAHPGH